MEAGISLPEITNLREFGNRLLRCKTVDEVVEEAFKKIDEKLLPQVVSLFLFSKDGTIKRVKIHGFDNHSESIPQNWLANEQYEPGESFSGKAAVPQNLGSSPYGEPYWQENLDLEIEKFSNGHGYLEKLGFLRGGISVPLNGAHRTFGTIEVLNRRTKRDDRTGDPFLAFIEEDVCWLTVAGAHIAAAISRIRKQEEEKLFASICRMLADPDDTKENPGAVYKSIANQFVSGLTPYKACILRMAYEDKLFVQERSSTPDVSFEGKGNSSRNVGELIVGEVYRDRNPVIVECIEERKNDFSSIQWISSQKLKSFICYPLATQGEVVGTISLFTGYVHRFSESDLFFLENVSYLIAAYRVGIKRATEAKTAKFEWRGKTVELDPNENRILIALSDKEWDFRTIQGISRETVLPESIVASTLEKYRGKYVRRSLSPDSKGNLLYALISRPISRRERLSSLRAIISKSFPISPK